MIAAQGNGSKYILFIVRNYDADRDLAVVRPIGGIESAAARVESNLAAQMAAKRGFKRCGVELRRRSGGWSNGLGHKAQNIFRDAGAGRKGIESWVMSQFG
jgi:hypothetical protein